MAASNHTGEKEQTVCFFNPLIVFISIYHVVVMHFTVVLVFLEVDSENNHTNKNKKKKYHTNNKKNS